MAVITHCQPCIGFPRTLNALACIIKLFLETKKELIRGLKMAKHEEVKNGIIFPVGGKNETYANIL
ncbi:MAG: hypothetical protein JWR72_428 [Flavisolibacter sp.]|nr:hypothetical protein [Flavisolibacter sp.]